MDMDVRCLGEIKRQQERLDSLIYLINWLKSIAEVHVKWFLTEKLFKNVARLTEDRPELCLVFWQLLIPVQLSTILITVTCFHNVISRCCCLSTNYFQGRETPRFPRKLYICSAWNLIFIISNQFYSHGIFSMWKWFCFVSSGAEFILNVNKNSTLLEKTLHLAAIRKQAIKYNKTCIQDERVHLYSFSQKDVQQLILRLEWSSTGLKNNSKFLWRVSTFTL